MSHYKRDKLKVREFSAADVWADAANEKAAKAMAAWMKASVLLSRPLSSLTLAEMKILAGQAIDTWIVEASSRMRDAPSDEERGKLRTLLM